MPRTRYPSRSARMVIALIAGLRPGTSPPPVRIAIVLLLAMNKKLAHLCAALYEDKHFCPDHGRATLGAGDACPHVRQPDRHRLSLQLRAARPGHLVSLRCRSRHRRASRGVLPLRNDRRRLLALPRPRHLATHHTLPLAADGHRGAGRVVGARHHLFVAEYHYSTSNSDADAAGNWARRILQSPASMAADGARPRAAESVRETGLCAT